MVKVWVGGTGQAKAKEVPQPCERGTCEKKSRKGTATIEVTIVVSFCGELGDESVCFVGKEATKVLERLQDWVDTTWGDFHNLQEQLGVSDSADSCQKTRKSKGWRDVRWLNF